MIRLNLAKFKELQGDMTEMDIARKLGICRSHLWRIRKGTSAVGGEFISKFMKAYPNEAFGDYFFDDNVDLKDRCKDNETACD